MILLLMGVIICCSVGGFAEETTQVAGTIIESGIYRVLTKGEDVPVHSEGGKQEPSLHIAKKIEFQVHTNTVSAGKGKSFGFTYRLINLPTNEITILRIRTSHPKLNCPGNSDDTGRTLEIPCQTKNGIWEHYVGFRFDDDCELVSGIWHFTISVETQKVLTNAFTIIAD